MGVHYSYNINVDTKGLAQQIMGHDEQNHPDGFNKNLRHLARVCLWANAFCLLCGFTVFASLSSAAAVFLLSKGTLASSKNLRWQFTCFFSMAVSFWAHALLWGASIIDKDRAYSLKMMLYIFGRGSGFTWGAFLVVFLFIAAGNQTETVESSPPVTVTTPAASIVASVVPADKNKAGSYRRKDL